MTKQSGDRADELANDMRRNVLRELDREEEPQPEFQFKVGWSQDYDDLFAGRFLEHTGIEELLKRASETGRVMLTGRGGSAKTAILRRIARIAVTEGLVPLLIDMKQWAAPDYDRWNGIDAEVSSSMEFLIRRFSKPRVTLAEFGAIPPSFPRVVLVDGLNEVSSSVAQEIVETVDKFVQQAVAGSVIVADRLVRRDFANEARWRIGMVMPLGDKEIARHLKSDELPKDGQTRALLAVPFFLNQFINGEKLGITKAGSLREYLDHHASLTEQELLNAASAAYGAYEEAHARVFSFANFEKAAGDSATSKLQEAGDLVVAKDAWAHFDHHLKHDFLASLHLVSEGRNWWTPKAFDTVSLLASSFDALAMVLEQLESTEDSDEFLRRVYDWNQYGAAYALAENRSSMVTGITEEFETVLLAMLAQRRWDLIESTAQRVANAISLVPTKRASAFLGAASLQEVFTLVDDLQAGESWFAEWKRLFTRAQNDYRDSDLSLITHTDSVTGWTAANVAKRVELTEDQLARLRSWLSDSQPTVRWRIAHVLGAFSGEENVGTLLQLLDEDDNAWVKYGSMRSLIEVAGLSDRETCESIFSALRERTKELVKEAGVIRELEQAIFINKTRAPDHWSVIVLSLLERLYEEAGSLKEQRRWEQLAYRLKNTYETGGGVESLEASKRR